MGSHRKRVTSSLLFCLLLLYEKWYKSKKFKMIILYCSCFCGSIVCYCTVICLLVVPHLRLCHLVAVRCQLVLKPYKDISGLDFWSGSLTWLVVNLGCWWAISFATDWSPYMWPFHHDVFRIIRPFTWWQTLLRADVSRESNKSFIGFSDQTWNSVISAAFYCYKLVTKIGLATREMYISW